MDLATARKKSNLTQARLATITSVHQSKLSRAENGELSILTERDRAELEMALGPIDWAASHNQILTNAERQNLAEGLVALSMYRGLPDVAVMVSRCDTMKTLAGVVEEACRSLPKVTALSCPTWERGKR